MEIGEKLAKQRRQLGFKYFLSCNNVHTIMHKM